MALSGTVEHATAFSLTGSPPDGANAWDGTAAHTVTLSGIASAAQGGTGIAYFTAAGPTVARVYTFPDAAATILYSGGDLGTPSAGVATNLTGTAAGLTAGVASAVAVGGITGLGTGVATALAVNVGLAGAPVVLDGALGTPSSGTGTNITGVNAATLGGATFAAPGTIGGGTPGAATFTTVGATTFTGALTGTASGNLVSGGALGTPSSGTATNITGLPEAGLTLTDNTTADFSTAAHGFVPKGTNVGSFLKDDGTWAAPTASATLDGITAAAGDEAGIANADWNIRWNWAKVTNSEVAFEFGESAAATGGTSTSGIPNQVLAKFSTLAASTMSPLQVYSRALHVFSVSPTARQILTADGTAATPIYSFASDINTGIYNAGADIFGITTGGAGRALFDSTGIRTIGGSASVPAIGSFDGPGTEGIFFPASGLGVVIASIENSRFVAAGFQASFGAASAVAYAINARKSRGTVASPTVITTGDDLLTLSGFGYVGATGTYVEGCKILFDSTGTIANTTSGLGGIMRFMAAKVGTVGPLEIMRLTAGTTTGGGWATLNEADASPGTADLADGDEAAVYVKAGNIVFAQNVAGTINFLYAPLDGATTVWTADTTGP